ncbi:MAG: hypothetical protein AAGB13_12395 [Cyanobacteria bacterium P01_F01_bin.33]
MQLEIIIKIITAIVAILGAGKIIYEITTGKRSRLREDYKFAKDFLEELRENPDLHPFAVEKGYQAIAGSTTISTDEIAYILSLKNPARCLNDYLLSKKYLYKLETHGYLRLEFSKKYASDWSRKWRKILNLLLYFFFSFCAIAPILMPEYIRLIVVTLPGFGYYAFVSLDTYIRIKIGEKLVKNQQRYTSNLHLPSV